MALSELDISLNIRNNRNYPQQISIAGSPANLLDTSNATREFRWNVTGFTFTTENSVLVQYKLNGASVFSSYSGQLPTQSFQAIIDVLNGLGIGFFNYYTELGQDYIGTYNQNYTFGDLNIYEASLLNPAFFSGTGFDAGVNFGNSNFLGGSFTLYNGTAANRIIRLNNDGSVDATFAYGTGFDNSVRTIAIQSDGKILVGGDFGGYNFFASPYIIRLNTDGSVDLTFVVGAGFNNIVRTIAVQSDGKILVGGDFTLYKGVAANRIIRLNTDGSKDNTFNFLGGSFDAAVNTIAIQTDGKILVGGNFTAYNGTGATRIIRLNTGGSIDNTFVYGIGFSNPVQTFAIQSNGQIIVGGEFQFYDGVAYNFIVRLNSNGSVDSNWTNQGFDSFVYSLLLQSNGQILCGGSFQFYNIITPCNGIARLNNDGTFDTSWNIGSGFDAAVNNVSYPTGSTSSILVGGLFTTFNGQTANRIANLLL